MTQDELLQAWIKTTSKESERPEELLKRWCETIESFFEVADRNRDAYVALADMTPLAKNHVEQLLGSLCISLCMILDVRRAKMMGIDVDAIVAKARA